MQKFCAHLLRIAIGYVSVVSAMGVFAADETITLSTYYPSSLGIYHQVVSITLGVGDTDKSGVVDFADAPDPANSAQRGDLWVAGDVGIGTNVIRSQLDVKGAAIIGGLYSGHHAITAPPNGLLVEGRVGIGTTAPSANLEVNNTLVFKPASAPAYASEGAVYYDIDEHILKYYDGTTWKNMGGINFGQIAYDTDSIRRNETTRAWTTTALCDNPHVNPSLEPDAGCCKHPSVSDCRADANPLYNGTPHIGSRVTCPAGSVVTGLQLSTQNRAGSACDSGPEPNFVSIRNLTIQCRALQ